MQIHEAIYKFEKSISEKNCKKLIPYMDKKCSVKAQIINDVIIHRLLYLKVWS